MKTFGSYLPNYSMVFQHADIETMPNSGYIEGPECLDQYRGDADDL
jgi:hypothetical protein